MRVYCHEALHLHEKLKRARDAQSVEMVEWTDGMSDDSSESDVGGQSDGSEAEIEIRKLIR